MSAKNLKHGKKDISLSTISIKLLMSLDDGEAVALHYYLDRMQDRLLPYHTLEFGRVIDEIFRYENLSLAAFRFDGNVVGFLPQWNRCGIVESVPWRDKGGPLYDNDEVLHHLIKETKRIVQTRGLKGFCWRNFSTDSLENYSHLVNVTVDLTKYTYESFPKAVNFKVRGKVKNALASGLFWKIETGDLKNPLHSFYRIFSGRRKELGVPVYPFRLFESYFQNIPLSQIKLFSIYK